MPLALKISDLSKRYTAEHFALHWNYFQALVSKDDGRKFKIQKNSKCAFPEQVSCSHQQNVKNLQIQIPELGALCTLQFQNRRPELHVSFRHVKRTELQHRRKPLSLNHASCPHLTKPRLPGKKGAAHLGPSNWDESKGSTTNGATTTWRTRLILVHAEYQGPRSTILQEAYRLLLHQSPPACCLPCCPQRNKISAIQESGCQMGGWCCVGQQESTCPARFAFDFRQHQERGIVPLWPETAFCLLLNTYYMLYFILMRVPWDQYVRILIVFLGSKKSQSSSCCCGTFQVQRWFRVIQRLPQWPGRAEPW